MTIGTKTENYAEIPWAMATTCFRKRTEWCIDREVFEEWADGAISRRKTSTKTNEISYSPLLCDGIRWAPKGYIEREMRM